MGAEQNTDDRKARAAVRAGALAYFVDQFDIYLPIVTLAPATAYFQSRDLDPATTAILDALVFVSTLIARPIGAAVFGHFADRTGRKNTTLVAVAGFGVTTLLIALLPGYQSIGMWSVGLLIALRFVDGFFLGGEYTTAVPLAMEWSSKRRRGLNSGLITATSPGAYSVIALITLGLLAVLPSAGVDSAYAQWGWRIPFVIGSVLAALLFVSYWRTVEESRPGGGGGETTSPLVALFTGAHRRDLAQVFVLMTGVWLANNMANAVMPGLLKSHLGLTSSQVTVTMVVATAASALSYPLFGHLSQVVGRRRFYLGIGLAMAVGCSAAYAALVTVGTSLGPSLGAALPLAVVVEVLGIGTFGPIAAYLTERFPVEIRASGYGVGYSLALIVPAFYAFYLNGLGAVMPSYFGPVALVVLAGLFVLVGAVIGPETKDNEMGVSPALPERV
ncbi:MFS transporter [Pseudonocardia acaciae]|uniref:MFS transporter n=1 Tax=Pseudonocardia acaciae TaxID=551276 RepID=UPI00055B557A|nr:MFS transporter [Pseudonocardia acaciae]